jgi:hypothetical protein
MEQIEQMEQTEYSKALFFDSKDYIDVKYEYSIGNDKTNIHLKITYLHTIII